MVKFGALMISGILLVVIGIILLTLGIVFIFTGSGRSKQWWVWLLIILGIILTIVGIVLILLALRKPKTKTEISGQVQKPQPISQTTLNDDGTSITKNLRVKPSYGDDDDL